jgi:hypothetical protein
MGRLCTSGYLSGFMDPLQSSEDTDEVLGHLLLCSVHCCVPFQHPFWYTVTIILPYSIPSPNIYSLAI